MTSINTFRLFFSLHNKAAKSLRCLLSSRLDKLDSLRMQLVKSPIHSHCDVQVVQASVLPDLIHHGRHTCSAQLSSTV